MKKTAFLGLLLLFIAPQAKCVRQIPPAVSTAQNGRCPSQSLLNAQRSAIVEVLNRDILQGPSCPCGGPGQWYNIARLNFSNPTQQCPANWRLTTTPVRGCGRTSAARHTCDSATFEVDGRSYSRVCGRVNAYQKGSPDAFDASVRGRGGNPDQSLEGTYLDGLSLTHGPSGSRTHIWSFVSALHGNDSQLYSTTAYTICPCINTEVTWPYRVPSFIGGNYFCDTGDADPVWSHTEVYTEDPLWDGEGCGPTNACCQYNTPPWFCATLPQPTTDDIELRACHDEPITNEDILIRNLHTIMSSYKLYRIMTFFFYHSVSRTVP